MIVVIITIVVTSGVVVGKSLLRCVQKIAASLTLDIGEDRILLETRSNVYHLDIYLPFLLIQAECGAQFNRRTKVRVYGNHVSNC